MPNKESKASPTEDPDLADVRAWVEGDTDAGDRLVTRHFDAIYRFFNAKVDGDVSDLVQSTFETCQQSLSKFEGRAKFKTWLWGIARNKVLEHFKQERRGGRHVDLSVTSLAELGHSPPEWIDERKHARVVLEAMRTIPLESQILLELFYWERLTGRELGQAMEVPENTARSRLRTARKRFTLEIERLEQDKVRLATTLSTLDELMESLRAKAQQRYPQSSNDD